MVHVTGEKRRPDWQAAWVAVRERMRRELGEPVFEAWIGPLSLESSEHDDLRIGAAKPFLRNWVANHYVARIERAFRAEGFVPASLSIVVSAPSIGAGLQTQGMEQQAPASVSYLPPKSEARSAEADDGVYRTPRSASGISATMIRALNTIAEVIADAGL